MRVTNRDRRRFLKQGAAVAGLVAAPQALELAGGSATAAAQTVVDHNALESVLYGRRSRFVTTTREVEGRSHSEQTRIRPHPHRPSARTPLAELMGTITPTPLHFTTQHCRVGGGAPRGRWPPSAAQTVRAVFPHTAFTKTSSRDEDRWKESNRQG